MSTLLSASRGPCTIEITSETGEKFTYSAMIIQHEINMGRPTAFHPGQHSVIEEHFGLRTSKEITLKFVELTPNLKKKVVKPIYIIEEEDML